MRRDFQKIVVMGLGYIGLPTASLLATKGHKVVGVDINEQIVGTINRGEIHIVEPDLDILVKSAVGSGNLSVSLTPEEADVFILAVPTPFIHIGQNQKLPDLSYVDDATKAIVPYLNAGNLVILESTSPVGTTQRVRDTIKSMRPDLFSCASNIPNCQTHLFVAHCPERVLPGNIIRELVGNDRIIGGVDRISSEKARDLYKTFCSGNIYLTDCKSAEMTKLVENSFRDVNIAFANELSMICDKLEINVWELIDLANKHPRVNILSPGPGVGGHCIAVDPWFIVSAAPEESRLIRTAREINDLKPEWIINKVALKASRFKEPIIGCLGLAFKANIDDLRESPAMKITHELISNAFGHVMACEPNLKNDFNDFPLYAFDEIIKKADIILLLVDHDEFREIDQEVLKDKVVIDCRGIWRQHLHLNNC